MPRKIIGTLTSNKLNFVFTLIVAIVPYKLYAIVTPKYLKPFYLEKYVPIVVFAACLQRALFYGVTKFLPYSTTIKLLPLIILIKGSYLGIQLSALVSAVVRKFMRGRRVDRYP